MSAPLLGDQGVVLCFSRPICPEHLRNEMLSSSVPRRRTGWKDRPGSLSMGAVAIGRGQVALVAPLWAGSADGTQGAELVLGGPDVVSGPKPGLQGQVARTWKEFSSAAQGPGLAPASCPASLRCLGPSAFRAPARPPLRGPRPLPCPLLLPPPAVPFP